MAPTHHASAAEAIPISNVTASAYTIPTDSPESDGTLAWDSTTMIVVEAEAGGQSGLGYTYGESAIAGLITTKLAGVVKDTDALQVGESWSKVWSAMRNNGTTGLVSMAISALDCALWDLKARLLGLPLTVALDAVQGSVPIYGSGGFCSYSDQQLSDQLGHWVQQGIPRVKIKVGREPERDVHRLRVARAAIGDDVELFVDANGAFTRSEALKWAKIYGEFDVRWLEEPVSSDDLEGLRLVRDRAPGGIAVAAGEYGWNLPYFQRMLDAGAVDCLQADVTRCGGITGFRRAGALCDARSMGLSGHCAPQLTTQASTSVWHLRPLEYFHDHARIEQLAFDGCLQPEAGGFLTPDRSRPGHGLTFKRQDVEQWRIR